MTDVRQRTPDPEPLQSEEWLRDGRPDWVRSAYSVLRDHEEAEDVVQDTLLAVLRRGERVERPEAYIARAVYWNALKRRARRRGHLPLKAVARGGLETTGPRSADEPLDSFDLERAVAGLPVAQQTVIRLRFYLGLSFAEIARNLSISINTAASRSRYALASLRRALRGAAGPTGKEDES
ncbi:MAG: sigma-70 family RNA polymerase sigma factor [Acidobacteriota bacterium]